MRSDAQLATTLKHARLVVLRGDLGAGKTTLVKGIAEGLHAASQEDVTSPTFTLIHEYRGPEVKSITSISIASTRRASSTL